MGFWEGILGCECVETLAQRGFGCSRISGGVQGQLGRGLELSLPLAWNGMSLEPLPTQPIPQFHHPVTRQGCPQVLLVELHLQQSWGAQPCPLLIPSAPPRESSGKSGWKRRINSEFSSLEKKNPANPNSPCQAEVWSEHPKMGFSPLQAFTCWECSHRVWSRDRSRINSAKTPRRFLKSPEGCQIF